MSANKPQFDVYTIKDRGENRKAYWLRIGGAWSNKDGSLSIILDALPTDGKLHVRAPNPKDESES